MTKPKVKTKTRPSRRGWLKVAFLLLGLLAVSGLATTGYILTYRDRIYPKTFLGPINFGGQTADEASNTLQATLAALPGEMAVSLDGQVRAQIRLQDLEPQYKVKETVASLMAVGRSGSLPDLSQALLASLARGNRRPLTYTLNEDKAATVFDDLASTLGAKAEDAKIVLTPAGTVAVTAAKTGHGVAPSELAQAVRQRLGVLERAVFLTAHVIAPEITEEQTTLAVAQVTALVSKAPLTLAAEGQKVTLDGKRIFSWITYRRESRPGGEAVLTPNLNREAIGDFVGDFAAGVNRQPQNARLRVAEGSIHVVKDHADGRKVNLEDGVARVIEALEGSRPAEGTIVLAVETVEAKVRPATVGTLGLKEIVGRGETDFKGSPVNRIHNLTHGTRFLDGILIAPGEEFSTVKTLGAVDGSTGYLPELVIKENRTIPEFGGGLCQVSTTLFRSVVNAGLKVTGRQNHSYRVGYYEPPIGLDATVYLPKPDLRFLNDTPADILIQGKVEGTKIIFELYGTKDGRVATISEPIVTNLTDPPAPAYVETDTLPKGTTKQIEKPHQGANASVTYTVSRDGKELFKQTFRSKYKAWQARYLVGTGEGGT